jgi:hypothetical protein
MSGPSDTYLGMIINDKEREMDEGFVDYIN